MDNSFDTLSLLISDFVKSTPLEIVRGIMAELADWNSDNWELSKAKLLFKLHNAQIRSFLIKIIDVWLNEYPHMESASIALAFNSALVTHRSFQPSIVELAWTGPVTANLPIRRTDQTLLQMISEAKEKLLIVSFAVYKADTVIAAISDAIKRGVKVSICLEDADESNGKVSFSGAKSFEKSIFRMADFYYWPLGKRPHTENGNYGSLHAKLAVADCEQVFISSANLTDYAMDLNMEMGVLIKDTEVGSRLNRLFEEMIIQGILVTSPLQFL
jgi:phosphatidylserine/phosphatidylglycerophosphate/cardiolipin synthase-like enzyme